MAKRTQPRQRLLGAAPDTSHTHIHSIDSHLPSGNNYLHMACSDTRSIHFSVPAAQCRATDISFDRRERLPYSRFKERESDV